MPNFTQKTFTKIRVEASSGSMISFMDPDPTGFRYTTQFFAHSAACKISVAAGPHSHRPPIQEAVADEVHKLLKLLSKNTVSEFAHFVSVCFTCTCPGSGEHGTTGPPSSWADLKI